ncbi:MAG TPA: phenylalanine--tRNA ligase subunit beta [Actinomycetota bacterium]|nr:phenylalanine--tRNA ligase subunit beta [Actinomycetota bacterium]
MKVPFSWLRELTPVDATTDDIAARLAMLGFAVDEIHSTGNEIRDVVVGKVLDVRDHPSSSKPLVLVQADVGQGEPLHIVCGARNFSAGDLVPVAVPGARLPGGFEITRRKLAGQESNGMLCSARELGIGDDHSGIMVLDEGAEVGDDVVATLGLADTIFDIDVTPNRPDGLSVLGIAREIAAAYGLPVGEGAADVAEGGPAAETLASVAVEDAKGCPRYVARVATGLTNGSSPWWMQRRLLACGMRPISAIVDITNYVLLERGHPLHAFDLATLEGRAIVVRRARKGETMRTLDGVERTFVRDDVLICDTAKPVAVAGVMGGEDSEVSAGTTGILLESALFDATRVLRTARRLGLRTEASVRFERGVDPAMPRRAADRAMALVSQICGGAVAPGAIDAGEAPKPRKPVRLSVATANARIGISATADEMTAALTALGCEVSGSSRTALRVTPPSWRGDIAIEEDLIEEVARVHGYDNVPVTLPAGGGVGALTTEQRLRRTARRALLGAGLSEAYTLSLISPAFADRIGLGAGHPWREVLPVTNPLSEDESVLRPSLLPGLLLAARHNIARRQPSVMLFEIGMTFTPSREELPVETRQAAWVMAGAASADWHQPERPLDFYDAKGAFESLAQALGVANAAALPGQGPEPFHPVRFADLFVGSRLAGVVGELHPRVIDALDLPARTAAGVVDLSMLIEAAVPARDLPLPRFPAVSRDLAVVAPNETTAAEIASALAEAAGPLLASIDPFDVYRGGQVAEGKRSVAFALQFRDPERTLTDDEVDAAMSRAIDAAAGRGWAIRS